MRKPIIPNHFKQPMTSYQVKDIEMMVKYLKNKVFRIESKNRFTQRSWIFVRILNAKGD